MSHFSARTLAASGLILALSAASVAVLREPAADAADAATAAKNPDVERARREVKMLDDLYKTTIVFITNTYVDSKKDVAAGEIARDLFAAMREKGWHDARLVDATGHPTNDENVPHSSFEKAAIKRILAGESYVDEVATEKGKQYLLAATLVPVVNEKCMTCHPAYKKVGQVIGAVSYKLPIE
ncbi:MAG TPA: DUF3365 domain-containing protein [Pirellulales bacterium]|nr:DUF3365 domain-containing protein [Pirellulales bacterium]